MKNLFERPRCLPRQLSHNLLVNLVWTLSGINDDQFADLCRLPDCIPGLRLKRFASAAFPASLVIGSNWSTLLQVSNAASLNSLTSHLFGSEEIDV